MIVVVLTAADKLPCVVRSLRQVRLHVEVDTWCGNKIEAGAVFQVPDGRVCAGCEAGLKGAK